MTDKNEPLTRGSSDAGEDEDIPFTDDPLTLSQFLALQQPFNEAIIRNFQEKAAELALKEETTPKGRKWLRDYCINHGKLVQPKKDATGEGSSVSLSNRALFEEAATHEAPRSVIVPTKTPAIKLNELVKKPESFDGYKPPSRKWIDNYEKASEANDWSEQLMVRYFPTFLDKTANDWFVTVAKRKLGSNPTWPDLRSAFIRHYLGDSDKQVLRREIERAYQGEKEKATNFIPRLIRLVELADANKPEDELVDLIRSKLRHCYQDKLVLCNTYTIEELNDACLRIEASMESHKSLQNKGQMKKEEKGSKGSKTGQANSKKANNDKKEGKESSVKTCYSCERKGHLARDCRSKSKANGEPCNPKPKAKQGGVDTIAKEVAQETTETTKSAVVGRIRSAGSTVSTVLNNVNDPLQSLITYPVTCNQVRLTALVDTEAGVSVVNHQVVMDNGWKIEVGPRCRGKSKLPRGDKRGNRNLYW